jgi:hypothetical protein
MTDPTHLKGDVHPACSAIRAMHIFRKPKLPKVTNQNWTNRIVAAQQVPASDNQSLRRGSAIDPVDQGVLPSLLLRSELSDYDPSPMRNFDSSLPVFSS